MQNIADIPSEFSHSEWILGIIWYRNAVNVYVHTIFDHLLTFVIYYMIGSIALALQVPYMT